MKGRALAAALTGAAAALLAAFAAGSPTAQATNSGQPHEARIPIATGRYHGPVGWQPVGPIGGLGDGGEVANGIYFDPRSYPAATTVRLRGVVGADRGATDSTGCVRLYDASIQQPVPGTQTCITVPADYPKLGRYTTFVSGPIRLPPACHVYDVQSMMSSGEPPNVVRSELLLNWTE